MTLELTPEEAALIQARRQEQAAAEPGWEPRALETVTNAEKEAAFEKLHTLALGIYHDAMAKRYLDDDADHWCFEAVMELLGSGVWVVLNRVIQ